jgi:hypothetical protein
MIIYSTKEIIFTSIISKYSQSNADIKHIWKKLCLFKKFQHLKKMWDNQNSKILKSGTIGNKPVCLLNGNRGNVPLSGKYV